MPLSRIVRLGDGVTDTFAVNFALGVIDDVPVSQLAVTCQVNNENDGAGNPVYRPITWLSSNLAKVGGTVPGAGQPVIFDRNVSKTQLIVDFEDGSVMNRTNLNNASLHALMVAHEALDGKIGPVVRDIDMGGNRLTNGGSAIDPQDFVTKADVEGIAEGISQGPPGPPGPEGGSVDYSTYAAASSAVVSPNWKFVILGGRNAAGDGGGGMYVRVDAEPTHAGKFRSADRYLPNGSIDLVNGGWWSVSENNDILFLEQFGAVADGVTPCDGALDAAYELFGTRGGTIMFAAKQYLFTQPHEFVNTAINLIGHGMSDTNISGTVIIHQTGTENFLTFNDCKGSHVSHMRITGSGVTGGYQIVWNGGCYQCLLEHVRMVNGYNSVWCTSAFYVRFFNVTWAAMGGTVVVMVNGVNNDGRGDAMEFLQCSISASNTNPNCTGVIIDGRGGSIKFVECAVLFGGDGIVMRDTTGEDVPSFLYFANGGFENLQGDAIRLEKGNHAFIGPCYISTDGDGTGVIIGSEFGGPVIMNGAYIRGNGRDGIRIEPNINTPIVISGSMIVNNGRLSLTVFSVVGAADSGGNLQIATSVAHNFRPGDRVRLSDMGFDGIFNADWNVLSVESATVATLQLNGLAFSGAWSGAGSAKRVNYGIRICENASMITATGNHIGWAPGINRQDKSVLIERLCTNIRFSNNTTYSTGTSGGYMNFSTSPTIVTEQNSFGGYDGSFDAVVTGTVHTGQVAFTNASFVKGQKIKIVGVAASLATGSCTVRLAVNGVSSTGVQTVTAGSVLDATFVSQFEIDSSSTAIRLTLAIAGLSGDPTDLAVSFFYKRID